MVTIRELLRIKPKSNLKLPEGFKARWIEALTSGEYKQSKGWLLSVNSNTGETVGHCCLGVASKLCEIGDNKLRGIGMLDILDDKAKRRLPKALLQEELMEQFAEFNDGEELSNGKHINDYTFPQIARWIEKYL